MAIYRYVKAPPEQLQAHRSLAQPMPAKSQAVSSTATALLPAISIPKYVPLALMVIGLLLIISVASPIVYHELVVFPSLRKVSMISPLPTSILETKQLAQIAGVSTVQDLSQPQASTTATSTTDYTQATNWFPSAPIISPSSSKITDYNINIPKLDINNATVKIGGQDLKGSLIQYGGTSNPGEFGSPVIFGHSILRQFYNPGISNPNRYLSIFSTIMTLKDGDEIFVDFDGIKYTYKVSDKYEIQPDQVEVLQQRYDQQTLKLITCTPEGTYLRRGVIEAQLIKTS